MKRITFAVVVLLTVCFVASSVFAHCGRCGVGEATDTQGAKGSEYEKQGSSSERKGGGYEKKGSGTASCYDKVCASTAEKGGVREITYEQFQTIRASGEAYVLVDALSKESYDKGHIEGALSFPSTAIDYQSAPPLLKKTDKIIVYCGSFKCSASTMAAHRLQALGYKNVLDYKGGLKEWQEKGNELVK